MAYESQANEVAGMVALSPKAAAMKKFINQNLGQPSILQFLQTEQGKQMDPTLAGALLTLERLEKARDNAPKGPAPSTSVVQDLGLAAAQEAQRERMEMARQRGIAQLPNPAMANARFQGGIATPVPPQMDGGGIKQMAGGGPVAFDDGGFLVAPKTTPSNPQNPLDDYRPDPMVQRQIQEEAGLGGMSEADKFRFYGMPMDPTQRPSDSEMFGSALKNVVTDPAALGAGLGAIVGGPIGIPIGGYLGRTVGQVVGKASGGPIAFEGGGLSGIDFTKMTEEQLNRLSKDPDREVSFASARELAKRKGINVRTPGELFSDIADVYRQSWKAPEGLFPLVKFSNERKFPSYMYDEKGNVRKGEVTGGIAGTPFYSSSNPQSVTPVSAAATASAAPSSLIRPADAAASGLTGPSGFDAFMAGQGLGADRTGAKTDITAGTTQAPAPAARGPGLLDVKKYGIKPAQTEEDLRKARIEQQKQDKTGEFAESLQQERDWITSRQKEYGEDKATATKNFWIMTGASLLGSRSPFFVTALGDAIKENYGNLMTDLKQLKKDQSALDLQKIKLTRAVETARETGSKEDKAEAVRQQGVYANLQLEVDKTNANIINSAANRDVELQIARIKSEAKDPTQRITALAAIQKNIQARLKDMQYAPGTEADKRMLNAQLATINAAIAKEGGLDSSMISGGGAGTISTSGW